MAYDEDLANRVRERLGGEPGITERRMFGGLAMMLRGNMAVVGGGAGGLMVRVDPAEAERALAEPGAEPRTSASARVALCIEALRPYPALYQVVAPRLTRLSELPPHH